MASGLGAGPPSLRGFRPRTRAAPASVTPDPTHPDLRVAGATGRERLRAARVLGGRGGRDRWLTPETTRALFLFLRSLWALRRHGKRPRVRSAPGSAVAGRRRAPASSPAPCGLPPPRSRRPGGREGRQRGPVPRRGRRLLCSSGRTASSSCVGWDPRPSGQGRCCRRPEKRVLASRGPQLVRGHSGLTHLRPGGRVAPRAAGGRPDTSPSTLVRAERQDPQVPSGRWRAGAQMAQERVGRT